MKLYGKSIALVPVDINESDAKIIINLRNGSEQKKYLNATSSRLNDQLDWLEDYKEKNIKGLEYYFFIEKNSDKEKIGTIRLYDFKYEIESFCWGSWILNENKTRTSALESCILLYSFAFDKLMFNYSHFDVRKDNEKVISFHLKTGAKIVSSDEFNYYFSYEKNDFINLKNKYQGVLK